MSRDPFLKTRIVWNVAGYGPVDPIDIKGFLDRTWLFVGLHIARIAWRNFWRPLCVPKTRDSSIPMMQSADHGLRHDAPGPLNGT